MEPAVIMRGPLPTLPALAPPRVFAAISVPHTSFGGGGGGGRYSAGGGGGGRGGGGSGDDSSDAGAFAAAAAAAAALGETEVEVDDPDAIVLHVGGMSCGGCAGKVKRILESQPEVTAATIDFEKAIAFVWTTPEAKAAKDWKQALGKKLANHLSTCGFQSHLQLQLQDEDDAKQTDTVLQEGPTTAHEVLSDCP
ncbi:hypothetical protein QOZ80_3AG0250540 [Eleusine coracana subsp. coracana]|nr:hypothetical protein QOZ80_3AG0250540 [Eleusine coracana subsp. coracana]